MEDFSAEKPRISKLIGPNYRPWSVQVKRLLVAQGLWNVVLEGLKRAKDGEGEEDPNGAEDPEFTVVKDAKASTIIMGLCSQDAL